MTIIAYCSITSRKWIDCQLPYINLPQAKVAIAEAVHSPVDVVRSEAVVEPPEYYRCCNCGVLYHKLPTESGEVLVKAQLPTEGDVMECYPACCYRFNAENGELELW